MRVPAGIALVLGLAVANLGCGGQATDPAAYGSELDAACLQLSEQLNALPGRVQSGELEVGQVQSIGERAEARFVSRVEGLEPPAGLAERQEELLATFERRGPGDDLGTAKAALGDLVEIYGELGADECERFSAESLARVEAVPAG